ncbi:alpha/beta hydrolase [Brachybacterium sp. GCM10030267]|uniref:alpha/beta hydrolase n=1 Tax=unclassified Brachybacterium TaxID=2623841 RepID=UPI003615F661
MSTPPQNPPVELISESIDDSAVVWSSAPEPARTSRPEQNLPIVLLLHGLGSHEHDLAGLAPSLAPQFTYASLRGIHRYVQGYAWLDASIDFQRPESLQTSAAAVETWISAQSAPVVGAIGFSQGAMLALQLLRRDPRALDWIVQLSGAPFPAPMPGDAALAEVRPPALWGHGGLDPLFDPQRVDQVREFMSAHTRLDEVHRPQLGHAVDEVELRAIASFVRQRADERTRSAADDR